MNYWLWLANIKGVGSVKKQKLLKEFDNSPEKIYKASKNNLLKVDGIGYKLCEEIYNSKDEKLINQMEVYMKKNGIGQLNLYDKGYPIRLRNIYDPPITLFYKGNIELISENCISIVGSRNASAYGRKVAFEIGEEASKNNFTVISGMARGIDTMAHKGALSVNGRTIAVVRLWS